jgi:hypothetical protein
VAGFFPWSSQAVAAILFLNLGNSGLTVDMAKTSTGIRQVLTEDWQPGPFCDIAIIGTTMEPLTTKHGFTPEQVVEDGIGCVSDILMKLEDGTRFVLRWHKAGNPDQASVYADITDRPYSAAIDKLLAALELDRSVVLWLSDDDGYIHQLNRMEQEDRLT